MDHNLQKLPKVGPKRYFGKIQDGGGHHLKCEFLAISWSSVKIFGQIWYTDRYYTHNRAYAIFCKTQDGGGHHLEFVWTYLGHQ